MSYTLKELTTENIELLLRTAAKKATYGQREGGGSTITSVLGLVQLEDRQEDKLLDKIAYFFKSLAKPSCDGVIILYQDIVGESTKGFVLYICGKYQDSNLTEAFTALQSTLKPLLYEGRMKLTKEVLKELILPKPMEPLKIRKHFMEKIQHSPSAAHPEWHSVIEAVDRYIQKNDSQATPMSSIQSLASQSAFSFTEHIQPLSFDYSAGGDDVKQKIARTFTVKAKGGTTRSGSRKQSLPHSGADLHVGSGKSSNVQGPGPLSEKRGSLNTGTGIGAIAGLGSVALGAGVGVAMGDGMDHIKGHVEGMVEKIAFQGLEELNTPDTHGKTALMIAVEQKYFECCMYLLLGGSDPNKVHHSTGNTSLHLAVLQGNPTLVKMLLVFNAEVAISNNKGKTALDCAKRLGSKEIQEILELADKRQKKSKLYFESNTSVPEPRGSKDTYLLSMDGGGIKAFNIAQALVAIESRMQQLNPKCEPFISYFDYVAGTSSGGIAALLLAYTDATPYTSRAVVYKIITDVFAESKSKRGDKMKEYLQEILPEDFCMAKVQCPRVIITSILADRRPCKLHLMTNYGDARDEQLGPQERKVWEAGRATSAAPHYFPPFNKYFLDGGIMANNPTVDAMAEVLNELKGQKSTLTCVLSLGTGLKVDPTYMDNVDVFLSGFNWETIAKLPKAVAGTKNLVSMLLDQVTNADGEEVTRAQSWCDSIGCDYYRISSALEEDVDPDTTDIDKVVTMLFNTEMYLLNCPEEIDKIAKKLLSK